MTAPTWTSRRPAVEGWYWHRNERGCGVVRAVDMNAGLTDVDAFLVVFTAGSECERSPEDMGGLWSGPLEQPEVTP